MRSDIIKRAEAICGIEKNDFKLNLLISYASIQEPVKKLTIKKRFCRIRFKYDYNEQQLEKSSTHLRYITHSDYGCELK